MRYFLFFLLLLVGTLNCQTTASFSPRLNPQSTEQRFEEVEKPKMEVSIDWRSFGVKSLLEAKENNKIILLVFGSDDCKVCQKMKETTFKDTEVVKLMNNNYVPIYLNGTGDDKHDYIKIMTLLGMDTVWPNLALLTPNGILIGTISGYIPPEGMKDMLVKIPRLLVDLKEEEFSSPDDNLKYMQ